MNLNSKGLRIAVTGDIHLGHRRTETSFIIENLDRYLSNTTFLASVDLLILNGDVFDDLLNLSDEDIVGEIQLWIARLIQICIRLNICVRVLKGTPSHDRGQSYLFTRINAIIEKNTGNQADLKYVDTLSIEYIERFDIHVLYVPDEWQHDTAITQAEVKELLLAKGLEQVDFTCIHGQFNYQIPEITKAHIKHDEQFYLSITKELIFVSHVHKPSQYERIHAPGSFDRLAHGEEEAKGFLYVIVEDHQQYKLQFIENKTARKYITLKCHHEDLEESLIYLDKKIKKLPEQSAIRIETKYSHPIANGLDQLKRRWPLYSWTILIKDQQVQSTQANLMEETPYVPLIINRETITELVNERLSRFHLDPSIHERALLHLEDIR